MMVLMVMMMHDHPPTSPPHPHPTWSTSPQGVILSFLHPHCKPALANSISHWNCRCCCWWWCWWEVMKLLKKYFAKFPGKFIFLCCWHHEHKKIESRIWSIGEPIEIGDDAAADDDVDAAYPKNHTYKEIMTNNDELLIITH